MKFLSTLIFIILASSSYRCSEDEITIDCSSAANSMVGTWKGRASYTNSQAQGQVHNLTLSVISSNNCFFSGIMAFDESESTFTVSGTIDKYGWVEFMETSYEIDGGEFTGCNSSSSSSWNNPCNRWPYSRWRPGTKFHEARYRSEPFVLQGEFFSSGGWNSSHRGTFLISKI